MHYIKIWKWWPTRPSIAGARTLWKSKRLIFQLGHLLLRESPTSHHFPDTYKAPCFVLSLTNRREEISIKGGEIELTDFFRPCQQTEGQMLVALARCQGSKNALLLLLLMWSVKTVCTRSIVNAPNRLDCSADNKSRPSDHDEELLAQSGGLTYQERLV
jgi:hypothetical protein